MSAARVLLSPPMILLHVLGVLAVCAAGWLGWWQISAWQTQREDRALQIADQEPRPLADVLGPDDPFPGDDVGRPVRVAGRWLPDSTLYVADRRRTAEGPDDGLWQVALLGSCPDGQCGSAPVVPVVLGWTDSVESGVGEPTGEAAVTGWLQPAEPAGEPDVAPDPGEGTDADVLATLRTTALLERTERDVYSGYVILDEPGGLRGDLVAVTPESLPRPPASTALRNLLYGVEWWVFAGFALYLWWRWSRDAVAQARQQARQQQAGQPEADEPVVSSP